MGFALRGPILWASRKPAIKSALNALPVTRAVVRRFVAGESLADAVRVAEQLHCDGMLISIDHLGEQVTDESDVEANVAEAEQLVAALAAAGLSADVSGSPLGAAELSVKLSALGQSLDDDLALASALRVARAAAEAGILLTIDMEDHSTTDATLAVVRRLRREVPSVGVAIQAMLRRTPNDLAELCGPSSRVRLVKGAYDEPAEVAARSAGEIEAAYAAALGTLFAGPGYPMVGSHSPALIARAIDLAERHGRRAEDFEFQMLHGIRRDEQRRLAERPANLMLFLRALWPQRWTRDRPPRTESAPHSPSPPRAQPPPHTPSAQQTQPATTSNRDTADEGTGHGRDHDSPDTP